MRTRKNGFTLVEVALFLAVTGALFVGVTVGVQNSIFQQRYNDSVQNFVELLRSVYSQVSNVQNLDGGRSETAIYGKLISFGESVDLSGCQINKSGVDLHSGCVNSPTKNSVFVYDVIGRTGDSDSGNGLVSLRNLNSNIVIRRFNSSGMLESVDPVGILEEYSPRWAAEVQSVDKEEPFKGAILIVRHPRSGTIYTFVRTGSLEFNREIYDINKIIESGGDVSAERVDSLLANVLALGEDEGGFRQMAVDFCIHPNPKTEVTEVDRGLLRADVRIIAGARNGSGVEIVSTDSINNSCVKE